MSDSRSTSSSVSPAHGDQPTAFPRSLDAVEAYRRQLEESQTKWRKAVQLGLAVIPRVRGLLGPTHPFAVEFDLHRRWLIQQAQRLHVPANGLTEGTDSLPD